MQQQQNTNSQPMKCKNEEHFEQQFVFFKFSEKIGEILQCMSCNSEDPQVNKKIIIDQIFKLPSSKIQNFPPLKNQKNSKQIQKIMENFTKEKIKQYIEYVNNQIDSYYQKINQDITQVLLQSKKDVLQQFEDILEFTNVSEFYDIAPVKEMIEKYQKNDIDLKQMFEQQLKMKKNFEDEKKFNIAINQEKIQNEVQNLIQNLKVQLDEKMGIFKERIVINTETIKKYKQEIQDVQQEIPQQNPGNQQDRNQQIEKNMYGQLQFRENEVDNRRKIIQQQNKLEIYYQDKYTVINNHIQAQLQIHNNVLPENQSNKFETLKEIKENLHTFINLDKNKQFQHLGHLMFPKVIAELEKYKKTADQLWNSKPIFKKDAKKPLNLLTKIMIKKLYYEVIQFIIKKWYVI
ncbi:hypothetical protein PPERSA_08282 [Pseudocohnilembus persalinus]|uniref:Uncharacterized protein n=1 Tax=Pseudocohnilembus persalinus TaxID=266149 RepID=A0A0V0Q7U9_PSEPJ|nr:hypothetical protein PPERSA_08282 [Pseudocohnilembus persalinus]|eukprot:KRW98119.1 hypothetical protein PPERSA_08282 [Pseudocohnilembus persalinus]